MNKDQLKELGNSLKDSEKALFDAITDSKNHVTLDIVSGDGTVDFGRFDGNGKNTIDIADLKILGSESGITASQVIGHETIEAFAGSKGKKAAKAHNIANKSFAGFGAPKTLYYPVDGNIKFIKNTYPLYNSSTKIDVTFQPDKKVPFKTFPNGAIDPLPSARNADGLIPKHVVEVIKQ